MRIGSTNPSTLERCNKLASSLRINPDLPFALSSKPSAFATPLPTPARHPQPQPPSYLNTSYKQANETLLHDMWLTYARALLQDYRINPGTIYAEDAFISPSEAKSLVDLGMNHFSIARSPNTLVEATAAAAKLAPYVSQLRSLNLTGMTSVYGFDEADQDKFAKTISEVFGMCK